MIHVKDALTDGHLVTCSSRKIKDPDGGDWWLTQPSYPTYQITTTTTPEQQKQQQQSPSQQTVNYFQYPLLKLSQPM